MFTVRTILKPSPIHGIGVFADEFIPRDKVVWVFEPRFDLLFSEEEVERLPPVQKDFIITNGYIDGAFHKGLYVLHTGNDRFTNHSEIPNTVTLPYKDKMIAVRDIQAGEEITCSYNEYSPEDVFYKENFKGNK